VADSPQHGADRFGCPEFRRNLALDRRGFVKAGALGLVGLPLSGPIGASDLRNILINPNF
tara:strand:+ start:681 stop:860 length:180 start_codon:yes stop_codon:yes gene_type:complete